MIEFEIDPFVEASYAKLKKLGVKAVLFDLDDTLVQTHKIFDSNMLYFSDAVASALNIDSKEVFSILGKINNEEYRRHGVDPKRWNIVLERLGQELGNSSVVDNYSHLINHIYQEEPEIIEGVHPLLSSLQKSNFLIGQVTHGETDWSLRKNDQAGITSYFDVIVTASVYGSKTKEHWLKAIDLLGVSPEECLIIGDNLKGDTLPAIEIGARAFALTSPWAVYREGEFPDQAVPLKSISDFWDAVDKLR